jgi:uncharacterized protein with HEPN domain
MPRDDLYLFELVRAGRQIDAFLTGVDAERWVSDPLVRSAVLHQLTIMGEIARAISVDIRERHPQLPWVRMRFFRNVAVHEYFAVEWPAVLAIARDDVPLVTQQAFEVLRIEFPELARRMENE